jgi:hypothetical protein
MQKSGMLHDFYVLGDYEPFASMRLKEFFDAVTPPGHSMRSMFAGAMNLRPDSDWDLLDLTSTRFYVTHPTSKLNAYLEKQAKQRSASGVVLHITRDLARIYERTTALPRAYFVPRARLVEDSGAALAALRTEDFAPRREVVLEDAPAAMAEHGGGSAENAEVLIVEDEPEKVVVTVRTSVPGFLVLTDAYHSDWEARSEQGELPLYRANHLFRAVPVEAGDTRIEMVYRAHAFHTGLAVSGVTALALAAIAFYLWRYRPQDQGR